MTEKAIIFDSGCLISFTMNGLTNYLEKLKGIFKGKFLITEEVKQEIIDKPIKIKRFELEAIRLKNLLDKGVLEMPSALGINTAEITTKAKEITDTMNSTFITPKKPVHLVDMGETSCVALSLMLSEKGITNVVAIDERTLRSFIEKPEDLKKYLQKKLHSTITPKTQNYKLFNKVKMIRSAELIYVAYKKGLTEFKPTPQALDALLYAVKFKGCAISGDEIRQIEKLR
jgi:hypothetical protein